jgi:hypothetical protein
MVDLRANNDSCRSCDNRSSLECQPAIGGVTAERFEVVPSYTYSDCAISSGTWSGGSHRSFTPRGDSSSSKYSAYDRPPGYFAKLEVSKTRMCQESELTKLVNTCLPFQLKGLARLPQMSHTSAEHCETRSLLRQSCQVLSYQKPACDDSGCTSAGCPKKHPHGHIGAPRVRGSLVKMQLATISDLKNETWIELIEKFQTATF